MKYILLALLPLFYFGVSCSAGQPKTEQSEPVAADSVSVYYFHYSRRCATCNAIEATAREAVKEINNGKLRFADFNLDENAGEKKGKELEVGGQSLLIVSGSVKINLTNEAFINARSNPGKLKSMIQEKIKELL